MGIPSTFLFLVIFITLLINYKSNRCPQCKKWHFKGFTRVDSEIEYEQVRVACSSCNYEWEIDYRKSDYQPVRESKEKD